MTETRTTSRTGGQKGVKAQRYDLLPKQGLDAIAELFGYGASKYADHNWRNRYEFSKSIAALERHTQAFKDGDTYDDCGPTCPDVDEQVCREHSRIEHLAAVGFHTLVLLTWIRVNGEGLANEFDDRWPHSLERARLAALQAEEDAKPKPTAAELLIEQEIGIQRALLTLQGGPGDDEPPVDPPTPPPPTAGAMARCHVEPVFNIQLNSVTPEDVGESVRAAILHERSRPRYRQGLLGGPARLTD